MARRIPAPSSLKRRNEWRHPRLRVVIVCEGEVTEPDYFKRFAAKRKNPLVAIEVIKKGGPIRQLVDKVIEIQNELKRKSKASKDRLDNLYEVWGVPDVDAHPKLKEALNLASEHNLNIALSNPCFELWAILHYREYEAPIHRHDAQRLLSGLMPRYCHDKHPYFDVDALDPLYENAVKNAKLTIQRRLEEGHAQSNPSTNVFKLMERIAG